MKIFHLMIHNLWVMLKMIVINLKIIGTCRRMCRFRGSGCPTVDNTDLTNYGQK
jgi:hypothetical protein